MKVLKKTIMGASSSPVRYLFPRALVVAHVSLQLGAVGEGVAALGAAEVVIAGLVAILDVLLQGGVALVTARAVRANVELGEGVWQAWGWERSQGVSSGRLRRVYIHG